MRTVRNAGVACAVVVAVVLSGSALAAKPKAGSYVDKQGNIYKIQLDVAKSKRKLTPSYYNKCSPVPVIYKAKINKRGKFKYHGTVTNVVEDQVKIKLKGRFVSKKKAKGTVKYSVGDCTGEKEKFVARYQKGG